MPQDDLELITRWKSGDPRAATMLVERHADALAKFAVSSGERDEIEELVQDTFVRAFSAMDSFRGESSFRTWLFTIERRLMLDRRRSEKRERNTISLDSLGDNYGDAETHTEYDALDEMIGSETSQRVRNALSSLSEKQREIFMLRVEQGLSYKEIAEVVDTTEGAARVHYHNAMRAVKEYLSEGIVNE